MKLTNVGGLWMLPHRLIRGGGGLREFESQRLVFLISSYYLIPGIGLIMLKP